MFTTMIITPETITLWSGIVIAIITAVTTAIISILVAIQKIKSAGAANFNAGVVIGSEATTQELITDKDPSKKANAVVRTVSDALKNPSVPAIDNKVEKAISAGGGILNLVSQAVTLLNVVKPNVFKK